MMKAETEKIQAESARAEAEVEGALVMINHVNLPRTRAAILTAIQAQMPDTISAAMAKSCICKSLSRRESSMARSLIRDCDIVPVDAIWLGGTMQSTISAFFRRAIRRENRPALEIAGAGLQMPDDLLFPELRNLSAVPALNRQEPGYDPASELFLAFPKEAFPKAPDQPTRADAEAAFVRLSSPFREYVFKDDASRAVALSGLMCAVARTSMQSCPLHAISAGNSGDGKTKIANRYSRI